MLIQTCRLSRWEPVTAVAENRTAALINRNDGSWLGAVIRMCDLHHPSSRQKKAAAGNPQRRRAQNNRPLQAGV
jgi:hypothetical protein